MSSTAFAALLGFLGSTGLATFITYCISRQDKKAEQRDDILKGLDKLGKSVEELKLETTRTQLLQLIYHSGEDDDNTCEILKIAEYYFKELHGDWYMSSVFSRWCERQSMPHPEWFKGED